MNKYILYQLQLHCKIYKLNYNNVVQDFQNNKSQIPLLEEFSEIYNSNDLNLYKDLLNNIFNFTEKAMLKASRDEKEILSVALILKEGYDSIYFFSWFLSFSFLNGLLYEKFTYERKLEKNAIEIIDLINYVYNDLCLFIDFLFVNDISNKTKEDFKEKSIKKFLFRITIILKNENILQFKKLTVMKEKNVKKVSLRYANMVEFEGFTKPKSLAYLFKISHYPATIKKRSQIILIGFYHYSFNTYLIATKKGKEKSIVKDNFLETLKSRAETPFFIDKEMLDIVDKRVSEIKNSNIENNLNILKIKHAIRSKEITKQTDDLEEAINELRYLKYQIQRMQKQLSISIDAWIFSEFKKKYFYCTKPIYFIPYSDFRGRIYFKSLVSPVTNWMFRFVYNFGKLDRLTENNLGILILNDTIKSLLKSIKIEKYLTTYAWIFLSIGVKFKKFLKLVDGKIKIDDFIILGIKKYIEYGNSYTSIFKVMDNMDAIETIYYITLVNNTKNNILYKRYIIKDTTASVYQHLGKILLFKNEQSLRITNLTSINEWYDTYEPLIHELKLNIDPEIRDYFYRKTIKPVFITTKYNVGWGSALQYYLDEIGYIKDKNLFKKIIKGFTIIYNNLKKGYVEKKILYKMSLEDFNNKVLSYKNIDLGDISISLSYYKMEKREINIFLNKKRYSMANYDATNILDTEQMQIAALPHIVHGLDALYARRIINLVNEFNIEIFTIHDAFAVPFYQLDLLIIAAWDSIKIEEKFNFTEKTNEKVKIDSITILI